VVCYVGISVSEGTSIVIFSGTYLPWCHNPDYNCKNFIKTNFHCFNQHGVLVSELQAPLTVFGNVKIRMWGDKEFSQISRGNLLATINTDAP
jgi:hypothetical protein